MSAQIEPAAARALTDQVRTALAEARRSIVTLAIHVRAAHQARAWAALGYRTWADYTATEFGIGRAHSYRLLDMADSIDTINSVLTKAGVSPPGDTLEISGRALREIRNQLGDISTEIDRRVRQAQQSGEPVSTPQVREIVLDVITAARAPREPVPAPDTGTDPVSQARKLVAELDASQLELGHLCLEIAPAYLSDADALLHGILQFAHDLGEDPETLLSCRRAAITGDHRALPHHMR